MDRTFVCNAENCVVAGNKIKGKAVSKESRNMPRKKLADIGNLPHPNHEVRPQAVSLNTEYNHKLCQENLSLKKLLEDRNKIIESQACKLEKLRTQCKELQQKNMEIAKKYSQILVELNSTKDRLKVLQHELGCKNGLLNARNLEFVVEAIKCVEIGKSSQADNKTCNKRWRRRFKSVKPVQVKENIEKRRLCSRKQSARFKTGEQVPTDDLFEISETLGHLTDKPTQFENEVDDKRHSFRRQSTSFTAGKQEPTAMLETNDTLDLTTFKSVQGEKVDENRLCSRRSARLNCQEEVQEPMGDFIQIDEITARVSPMHECGPSSSVSTIKLKFETADCASKSEDKELQRPKRQAAQKVQSYKEIPLNIKMRRPE